ncbi:MAG TPA: rod shape-determining protein MreC [Anaerolineales bacterium]|nr:rod shape-determining protein MreC [Anaerolineales bacterium]
MIKPSTRTLQIIVLVLLVAGAILLALGGYLAPVSRYVLAPVVNAQTWLATRYQAIENFFNAPQDLARLRQTNQELEAEVARLEAEIINLNQQLSETRVLSALVDFARAQPENRYLAAAVIGRDPSPFLQDLIINRGSDDGIRRGMPVVTDRGLVGRISRVTANAASIQLITDPATIVNIRLEPSRAQAVLIGSITGEVTLEQIPQSAEVQPGDLLLTSGLGGNYPGNILIGQITGVRSRDLDLFQSASVQPTVEFDQLEIVLIITNFNPIDISPLTPAEQSP